MNQSYNHIYIYISSNPSSICSLKTLEKPNLIPIHGAKGFQIASLTTNYSSRTRSGNLRLIWFLPELFSAAAAFWFPPGEKGQTPNEVVTIQRQELLSVLFSSSIRKSIMNAQSNTISHPNEKSQIWNSVCFLFDRLRNKLTVVGFFYPPPRTEEGQSTRASMLDHIKTVTQSGVDSEDDTEWWSSSAALMKKNNVASKTDGFFFFTLESLMYNLKYM